MAYEAKYPFQQFTDTDGTPINDGDLYIGAVNLAPQTNQITVYWDEAGTIPAAQPLSISGGYIVRAGTPARVYLTPDDYSMALFDKKGRTVWTALSVTSISTLRADLAASGGSAMVGYLPAGTGAVTDLTVQDVLRGSVSLLQYGKNTVPGTTDMSAALIAARTAAAGKKICVPAGHYKFNQAVTSSEDLIIEGDGQATILDFTGSVTGGSYALEAIGTATQIEELSGTQTVGTNAVTFASAPSLSVGDVFVIYNPTDASWSNFRPEYHAGEWCEVESISGSVVTVRNQLYDTYAAADVDVYKITGPRVAVKNCSIIGTTVTGLIRANFCISPLVENVKATHANDSVVYFDRCFKPVINNPDVSNVGDGGNDYGIVIGNSQHVRVNGGNAYSRRHAVTHGGTSGICNVPVRDSRVIGSVLKNDPATGLFSADFHGNTEDSSYIDCTIYGGATWQGKDVKYVNCTITADSGGRVLYSAEIKGGNFGLENCKLITHVNPQANGRGIVDIGGANSAITADTVLPCTFAVTNCTLYGRNMTSATNFLLMENWGATVKTNIVVDGVTADVNAFSTAVRTQVNSGTAAADYFVIDRLTGFPSGTFLHVSVSSAYTNFPHRCQTQSGVQTLTATSGTNNTQGTLTTFQYSYPRTPSAQVSSVGGFVGNVMALGGLVSLSTTQIRPSLISADATNWTATADRVVGWSAGLAEV